MERNSLMSQQHYLSSVRVITGHLSLDSVLSYQYSEIPSRCVRNLHRHISQMVNKSELGTLAVFVFVRGKLTFVLLHIDVRSFSTPYSAVGKIS